MTGPVIEPTDEMERAYKQANSATTDAAQVMNCSEHGMGDCPYHQVPGAARRAGIAAVLAIVERDYTITPKQPAEPGQCGTSGPDGLSCGRIPNHVPLLDETAHHAAYADESGELVRW